jgi:hypothetical protein
MKFAWEKFIVDGLYKDISEVGVNKQEIILIEDSAYLGNFSEIFDRVMGSVNSKSFGQFASLVVY